MSYLVVDKIIKSNQFNATEKLVMIALASFGDNNGNSIFPAQKKIAQRASLTTRTLMRTIDKLIESGFLTKQAVSQDNLKRPNKYFVNVDAIQCDRESHRCDRESQGCDSVSGGVVTLCQGGSDRESHKPTIYPTIPTLPVTHPLYIPPPEKEPAKETKNNKNNNNKNDSKNDNKNKYTSDFEDFWNQYPKKAGKAGAFKAYQKAIKTASHAEIIQGVMMYSATNLEPQFIKHPQGWLNDERWKDDYSQQRFNGGNNGKSKDNDLEILAKLKQGYRIEQFN